MKTRNYFLGAAFFACLSSFAQQAEELDEVVVTDSKFELKRENSGKVVVKITREELEKNQGKSVAEVISFVSGIVINGAHSNAGQNISTFVRGGNNRQVLILIDGVQLSDPSTIANDYDLRLLDINAIESIEIIKGAASTLYGSGAATVVINIKTRKASREKIALQLTAVAGTNEPQEDRDFGLNDFQNRISVNGTLDKFSYVAGYGNQFTDGLSAVIDPDSDEKDPFSRHNTNLKLGYEFSPSFQMTAYGSYDHFEAEYDNTFPREDADFESISDQSRFGITSEYNYDKGSVTVNAAYNKTEREFRSNFPSAFDSDSYVLDAYNKYTFNDKWYTVLGLNYINNKTFFGEEVESTIADPYMNAVYVSDFGFQANLGARLNNHSDYGSHLTYSANPSYTFERENGYLKAFGSYATSFIAPSLTQLYGNFGANPDLEPEENRTLEGGLEYKTGVFRSSATYFNRLEENFIDYVILDFTTFQGEYQNVTADFTVQGVELEVVAKPVDKLMLRANYTFTENKDRIALRIPKHKINAIAGFDFTDTSFLQLSYQYQTERTDIDFLTGQNVELDSYGLLDLYFSQQMLDSKLKLFIGLNNLFNEDYRELVGFTTRGRNVRFGLNLNL